MTPPDEITTWHPADIFSDDPVEHKGFALVVLNQSLKLGVASYLKIWQNAVYHVGADGGANQVFELNAHPDSAKASRPSLDVDTIIGDLDSLRPEVREYWHGCGSEIIQDGDQYSTDFTKAVRYLRTFQIPEGADFTPSKFETRRAALQDSKDKFKVRDIVCLGGLGGRVDQGMSTLHHLYTFQQEPGYPSGRMFLLSTESITFVLQSGKHRIKVRAGSSTLRLGKYIGIIPLKEPSIITTNGLEWDVAGWLTHFGGQMSTSNHVREEWVKIETSKDVLFTISLEETCNSNS
jgi:thiamine pyrophosphokinase